MQTFVFLENFENEYLNSVHLFSNQSAFDIAPEHTRVESEVFFQKKIRKKLFIDKFRGSELGCIVSFYLKLARLVI